MGRRGASASTVGALTRRPSESYRWCTASEGNAAGQRPINSPCLSINWHEKWTGVGSESGNKKEKGVVMAKEVCVVHNGCSGDGAAYDGIWGRTKWAA